MTTGFSSFIESTSWICIGALRCQVVRPAASELCRVVLRTFEMGVMDVPSRAPFRVIAIASKTTAGSPPLEEQ